MKARENRPLLKVGDLARAVGKSVRAMHLYEEMGLLEPVSRSSGGYRLYAPEAISRVNWIVKLQGMGFSLPDIRAFLRDYAAAPSAPDAMARVRAIFEAKLEETRDTMARLADLERDLMASLAYLESCGDCKPEGGTECPGCGQRGHDPAETPDLVAGLAGSRAPRPPFDVPASSLTPGGNR